MQKWLFVESSNEISQFGVLGCWLVWCSVNDNNIMSLIQMTVKSSSESRSGSTCLIELRDNLGGKLVIGLIKRHFEVKRWMFFPCLLNQMTVTLRWVQLVEYSRGTF